MIEEPIVTAVLDACDPHWAARREFIRTLVALKYQAFEIGFVRTGHAIDEATRAVGWELLENRAGGKS